MRLGSRFFSTYTQQLQRSRLSTSAQQLRSLLQRKGTAPVPHTAGHGVGPGGATASPVSVRAASSTGAAPDTDMQPQQPEPEQAATSEQDLSLALDYRPSLGPLQELFCLLLVATACAAVHLVALAPRLGKGLPGWQAAGALAVLALTLRWLARNAVLEGMYKARERLYRQLGDADSSFRAINNLAVHVKTKVASGLAAAAAAGQALPALHCYHGFGANLGSYMLVQDLLAERLRGVVTAHDMPGFGLTQRPSDMSSYFLAFNGRLGRLVMDFELQQLGVWCAGHGAGHGSGAGHGAASTATPRPVSIPLGPADSASSLEGASASAPAPAAGAGATRMGVSSKLAGPGSISGAARRGSASDAAGTTTLTLTGPGNEKSNPRGVAQEGQAQAAGVKRVLLGHSLGGACAALEALSDPDGLSGLVLVAPAIFAFPGPAYAGVTLAAQPPSASEAAQQFAAAASAAPARHRVAIDSSSSTSAAHPEHPQLAQEPVGSHATDPLTVRRLYPAGTFPKPHQQAAQPSDAAAASSGLQLGWLLAAVLGLAKTLVLVSLLVVLRLLAPAITLVLRVLVRSRAFWQRGLQQAYYNPDLVTPKLVDAYRMPQLVRGWEAGMVNFLLARLVHTKGARAALAEALRPFVPRSSGCSGTVSRAASAAVPGSASSTPPPSPSSPAAPGSPAAAAAEAVAAAALASEAATADAAAEDAAAAAGDAAGGGGRAGTPEDQGLATRLAALVAARRLPVLIIHGEQDRLVPAGNSQRLARMLPGCELVLLDRCGHMPQEEVPQLFCDLVCEFVAHVGAQPAQPAAAAATP